MYRYNLDDYDALGCKKIFNMRSDTKHVGSRTVLMSMNVLGIFGNIFSASLGTVVSVMVVTGAHPVHVRLNSEYRINFWST